MTTLHRITNAATPEYRFMEELITTAFPPEEYRDLAELRRFTSGKRMFHNNLICSGNTPVGIITYWDFGSFHYIEHFATLPFMRNRGYGKTVLMLLQDTLGTPLVLEVEEPVDDISRRRIGFYERCGFRLWHGEYRQPPYRPGGDFLPMRLMAYGDMDEAAGFSIVKKRIYAEVYGCYG